MSLALRMPYPPMEARSVDAIPSGPEWQYEPKWDGFRCLAFRNGDAVDLQSKAGEPLGRYFPEMVDALRALGAKKFVLDGELAIPEGTSLSFEDLLMRIHPAESRVRKLAAETPAIFIVFDLLLDERGTPLVKLALEERRKRLEAFSNRFIKGHPSIVLSPATDDPRTAMRWFQASRGALDGVISKRRDLPYQSGNRDGMQKFKQKKTADCVVGGFRYASSGGVVGSLLLGLYDDQGLLHHVGFTSSIPAPERKALTAKLRSLIKPPGFTGNAPGGPSRWSTERSTQWEPLKPRLVVEVEYDHTSGDRFRHGTRLVRWRPDKAPRQCTFDQIAKRPGSMLRLLKGARKGVTISSADRAAKTPRKTTARPKTRRA